MSDHIATTEAGRRYAAAHEAHYATKDLHEALELYMGVMAAHPNTQEAEYSRTQMHNVVKSVVPKEDRRFPVTYWVAARDAADRGTGSHAAAR